MHYRVAIQVKQTDEAWSALQQCFSETIRIWIRSHPSSDVALLHDSEENYLAQTFSRFWFAVRDQHVEFTTLSAALSYLRAILNGLITDTLRAHLRLRSREAPLPEPGLSDEPCAEEPLDSQGLWESTQPLLLNERERRIFYLLYCCGLKPREIVIRCSQEFADVKEIYRLISNIVERLRRHSERVCYLLGSDA
jgi:DNA-directed RNA polymerase specialized sigma24 family protein